MTTGDFPIRYCWYCNQPEHGSAACRPEVEGTTYWCNIHKKFHPSSPSKELEVIDLDGYVQKAPGENFTSEETQKFIYAFLEWLESQGLAFRGSFSITGCPVDEVIARG